MGNSRKSAVVEGKGLSLACASNSALLRKKGNSRKSAVVAGNGLPFSGADIGQGMSRCMYRDVGFQGLL
jgi:hypothetical protein